MAEESKGRCMRRPTDKACRPAISTIYTRPRLNPAHQQAGIGMVAIFAGADPRRHAVFGQMLIEPTALPIIRDDA